MSAIDYFKDLLTEIGNQTIALPKPLFGIEQVSLAEIFTGIKWFWIVAFIVILILVFVFIYKTIKG